METQRNDSDDVSSQNSILISNDEFLSWLTSVTTFCRYHLIIGFIDRKLKERILSWLNQQSSNSSVQHLIEKYSM